MHQDNGHPSLKQLKLAAKSNARHREMIAELGNLTRDIQRCETTILALQADLAAINARHQNRRSTREDVDYLTELLDCAKRKLAWEKLLASLQKRTPLALERMTRLLEDFQQEPAEALRAQMLEALQKVQAAMARLQAAQPE